MPLEIRHVSLMQLLSRPLPFHMARYQRRYEWGRREMEQLLSDLGEVFDVHRSAPAADAYHFLGNIILFAHPEGHFEVVDGQQRLTSLTALMAAARDADLDAATKAVCAPLLYLPGAPGKSPMPRLKLHRGDDEFLRAHILADGQTAGLESLGKQSHPGAECMRTNTMLARSWLLDRPPAERAEYVRFVAEHGRFVEIQVGTEDDAFRIFETVNSRGRPIASEDVLRYALIEYATDDPARRDSYLNRWDEMESELGPRGMKRFISGWRTRATKGARFKQALHRTLLDSFTSPPEARGFLDNQLSADLSIFREIDTADIALDDGPLKRRIDTLLRSLALVDFDEWLPIVTEVMARGKHAPERVARDLARVERLAWFFYLSREDKGTYQDRRERFASLMKTVAGSGTFDALPKRSLLSVEQCTKMRECVQERLDPKWVPLRSLMVRLEMALAGDGAMVVRDDLTIEHVLPLRPKAKSWLAPYGDDLALVAATAEQIGNLCLVSAELNTRLGNQIYANKRRLMMQHNVPVTSPLAADIARQMAWTQALIQQRSRWLQEVFCATFDIAAASA